MPTAEVRLDLWLKSVVKDIEPSATQKAAAKRSQRHLRTELNTGQFESRILDSYLSGSYARNTALHPLNDVDVIFVIDPAAWKLPFLSSRPSPQQVLESFARSIRYRYKKSTLRLQRRSVGLRLFHLNIDVVPAIPEGSSPDVILIPDRTEDDWIRTAPLLHSDVATAVNQKRQKRFKPLVKLLKLWNAGLPANAQVKSFTIETIATRIFQRTSFGSLAEGLILFWDFMASRYNHPCVRNWPDNFNMSFNFWAVEVPDTAGIGGNTAQSVDNARAKRLCEWACNSRDHLRAALNSGTEDAMRESVRKALRYRE